MPCVGRSNGPWHSSAPSISPAPMGLSFSPQCTKNTLHPTKSTNSRQSLIPIHLTKEDRAVTRNVLPGFFSAHGSRTDLFSLGTNTFLALTELKRGPSRGQKLSPFSLPTSHDQPKSIAAPSRTPTFSQTLIPTEQSNSSSPRQPQSCPFPCARPPSADLTRSAHPSRSLPQ
jgi:hypothetical protein